MLGASILIAAGFLGLVRVARAQAVKNEEE